MTRVTDRIRELIGSRLRTDTSSDLRAWWRSRPVLVSALGVVVVVLLALIMWGFAGRPDPEAVISSATTAAVEATVVSETTTATPGTTESQASTMTMVTEPLGKWVPIPDGPWAHPSTVQVWTGNELIVFPQYRPGLDAPAAGLGYDPETREWRMLTAPPELRWLTATAWTGTRLVMWGGAVESGAEDFTLSNTGFSYDPVTDEWAAIPAAPLDPQTYPFHVWTGQELIVWGGSVYSWDCCFIGTTSGAAYNPETGRWRLLSDSPLGSRNPGVGVWTGTEMIIGGNGDQTDGDATWAAYDPVSDSWRRLPDPPVRAGNVYGGVWTGSELIFAQDVGDEVHQSRLYALDPATDTWRELTAPGQSLYQTASVWTGQFILYWGETGYDENDPVTSLAYDPAADQWIRVSGSPLTDRFAGGATTVIGPNTVLIWGGADYGPNGFSDGAILDLEG